jgi:hypothetical protein
MLDWKRAAADLITSGEYAVIREDIFGERMYRAEHGERTLALAYEPGACRLACERHAQRETATHRAEGEK